jgi:phosphoribosylformylglycinamidine synthase
MSAEVGIVLFPGTNCEHDVAAAVERAGGRARIIWHGDRDLGAPDAVVIPGGFAHGDYLRPGAIARFSPVMAAVEQFANDGGPVVGICNGFQVLTEAHLLPGALQKNRGLGFLCTTVELEVTSERSVLTSGVAVGRRLQIPINHFEGNYTCDATTLAALEAEGRIVLRYVENPNGSVGDIAGIANAAGNVVGLMPHPERASDALIGSVDGLVLIDALLAVGEGAGGAGRARSAASGHDGVPDDAPTRAAV